MDRKKMLWRVYRIDGEDDLEKALAAYERVTGQKPVIAQVSERVAEDVLKIVERSGIEIMRGKSVLPLDVWLTHEREQVQPQLRLFGEVKG